MRRASSVGFSLEFSVECSSFTIKKTVIPNTVQLINKLYNFDAKTVGAWAFQFIFVSIIDAALYNFNYYFLIMSLLLHVYQFSVSLNRVAVCFIDQFFKKMLFHLRFCYQFLNKRYFTKQKQLSPKIESWFCCYDFFKERTRKWENKKRF